MCFALEGRRLAKCETDTQCPFPKKIISCKTDAECPSYPCKKVGMFPTCNSGKCACHYPQHH